MPILGGVAGIVTWFTISSAENFTAIRSIATRGSYNDALTFIDGCYIFAQLSLETTKRSTVPSFRSPSLIYFLLIFCSMQYQRRCRFHFSMFYNPSYRLPEEELHARQAHHNRADDQTTTDAN